MPMTATQHQDFCLLRDQEPLTKEGYRRALQFRDKVRALIDGRLAFFQRKGLDPEIHLPMANWALGEGLHALHRTVLTGEYAVLNSLRLFTQIFSGFQLISQSHGDGLPVPGEVPEDLDDRLQALADSVDSEPEEVQRYRATVRHLPELLHIAPPRTLGEVGWLIDGKIVNHDTDAYLERLVLLAGCGQLWELRHRKPGPANGRIVPSGRPLIVEIGSGYGGLAYHLKKLIPHARYVLVDIPESLLTSSIYLSTLFPEEDNVLLTPDNLSDLTRDAAGFTFMPNYLFDEFISAGLRPDLVINTLSMSEMSEKQVRYYCATLYHLLGAGGVFFEQNRDTRFRGYLDARWIIADCLPYCLPLRCEFRPLLQGSAHLWAASPAPPYSWQVSRKVYGPSVPSERTWSLSLKRFGKKLIRART